MGSTCVRLTLQRLTEGSCYEVKRRKDLREFNQMELTKLDDQLEVVGGEKTLDFAHLDLMCLRDS